MLCQAVLTVGLMTTTVSASADHAVDKHDSAVRTDDALEGDLKTATRILIERDQVISRLLKHVTSWNENTPGWGRIQAVEALADLGAVEVIPILVRDITYQPNGTS